MITLTVSAEYRFINKEGSPCGSSSFALCHFKCQTRNLAISCGCIPLPITGPDPTCRFSQLMAPKCLTAINSSELVGLCDHRCHKSCQKFELGFTATFLHDNGGGFQNATRLDISADPLRYPVMQEILLMSNRQLLGSLGGNLSLYLGISFMSLVYSLHFVVRCVGARVCPGSMPSMCR